MKFQTSLSLLSLAFSSAVIAAPSGPKDGCVYPIGHGGQKNAKVAGRLFEIDGKVQYFAGKLLYTLQRHEWILRIIGTNAWWLAHVSSNKDVDTAVSQMVKVSYLTHLLSQLSNLIDKIQNCPCLGLRRRYRDPTSKQYRPQ